MNLIQKISNLETQKLGLHLLRLALASVFLWFGFSQLMDSLAWVSFVPNWATKLSQLPPVLIVMLNGALEVVLGSFLAVGFWVRPASLILALHLLPIAFSFGASSIGVRDFGLSFSSLALSLIYRREVR